MLSYFRSERLKHKGKFTEKILWMAPLGTLLLAVALVGGENFLNGAYNWWYTIVLPGVLSLAVGFSVSAEKRKNRHGLLAVATRKSRLWRAQIALYAVGLLLTIFLFCAGAALGRVLFGGVFGIGAMALASIALFVGFAWQIPLWMWVTEIGGPYFAILLSLGFNSIVPVRYSVSEQWWLPFAVPARLMAALLGIQPNGLWVETGSPLTDGGVVLPGIVLSIVGFLLLTAATTAWFEKKGSV